MRMAAFIAWAVEEWMKRNRSRIRHVYPHWNLTGGCKCKCSECVRVVIKNIDDPTKPRMLVQQCCCKGCNHSCDGIGRLDSVNIDTWGR